MIILDTNVLSELCRDTPNKAMFAWYALQLQSELFLTTVTRSEMVYGLMVKSPGKKRDVLVEQVFGLLHISFSGRQLPFDERAADVFAELRANARRIGRPTSVYDMMIGAIAKSRGFTVATRNLRDFESFDIPLINPFDEGLSVCGREIAIESIAGPRPAFTSVKDWSPDATYRYKTN